MGRSLQLVYLVARFLCMIDTCMLNARCPTQPSLDQTLEINYMIFKLFHSKMNS